MVLDGPGWWQFKAKGLIKENILSGNYILLGYIKKKKKNFLRTSCKQRCWPTSLS